MQKKILDIFIYVQLNLDSYYVGIHSFKMSKFSYSAYKMFILIFLRRSKYLFYSNQPEVRNI